MVAILAIGATAVAFITAATTSGLRTIVFIILGLCLLGWLLFLSVPPTVNKLKFWQIAIKSHQTLINEIGTLKSANSTLKSDNNSLSRVAKDESLKHYMRGKIDMIGSYLALFPHEGNAVNLLPVAGMLEDSEYIIYAKPITKKPDVIVKAGCRYLAKNRELGFPIAAFVVHDYNHERQVYRMILSRVIDQTYVDTLSESARQHAVPDNLILLPDDLFTRTLNEALENGI